MKRKAFASLAAIIVLLLAAVFQLQGAWPTAVLGYPLGQRGPRIDTLRHKVTRSPDAQLIEMTLGPPTGSDMWMGMIRPTDVEKMDAQCKTVSSRSLLHFCEFGFNMRSPPLDDVNFRHALAHLVPKEKIIGTLFKYVNIPISTPVPPAQGLWYNPYTDPHPYSRAEAEAILAAAGYQKIGGEWKMPDTSNIPNLRVYIPLEIVAPTSYTIGRMFVDECHAIGLTSLNLEPMDFGTYTDLVFDDWDFDIFWVCCSLGRFPTLLYSFFHSSNLFLGSSNCYGINYPALDAEIETFYFGLDHPAKVAAAKKAQELVMGGTTIDPLAKPAQAGREQAIPLIPVYSRNAYDTQQPDLRGAINMFGYGIDNIWTYMNIHWDTPNEYRPGTSARIVVPVLDEFPETLNPTSARTVYAWTFMDAVFDGLMATNPYTHRDEPWLATSWSYGLEAGGMYIKFDLRTTDFHGQPIKWQDGVNIAPGDVQFSWDFLADHQISRYWDDMKYYTGADVIGTEVTAHMSTTSQWTVYTLAGTAFMLPPAVWGPWVGELKDDIEAWDPSAEAGPGGLPTKVYGVGPFILQDSTLDVANNGYGDLDANRNYWLSTAEIQDMIVYMFWRAGDVNRDGVINDVDLERIKNALYSQPGDPNWDSDADITGLGGSPPDGWVNMYDLATAGKYYGETREVTPGSKLPVMRSIEKSLSPSDGELGDVVHVNVKVGVPTGEIVTVVDTLPLEFKYILGTFMVDGVPATPVIDGHDVIYTITTRGVHTMEFDVKVIEAYWEDREVCNVVVGTWYDEAGIVIDELEATACFIIHAFEELSKSVSIDCEPVYLYVNEEIPLWDHWTKYGTSPYLDAIEDGSYIEGWDNCMLSNAYGFEDITLGECTISKVTLEGYTNGPYDQDCDFDVYTYPDFDWLGSLYAKGEPAWVTPRWVDGEPASDIVPDLLTEPGLNSVQVVVHFWTADGLPRPPGQIDALRLKVEFDPSPMDVSTKVSTETQWTAMMEVTNTFSYTMTDVVITDRFGAEIEIDDPFPYSITDGTVSYETKGKSKKVFLTWEIGDLLPGETARLTLLVSTDINPGGHQEYSEPGIYELNSGATLKFIDPEQDMQLSAVTDSIYVTVLPLEDP